MPRGGFSGSLRSPKIDVVIDMGNPFLNRTVDGFLKISAVGACKVAAEETFSASTGVRARAPLCLCCHSSPFLFFFVRIQYFSHAAFHSLGTLVRLEKFRFCRTRVRD
jgi:hypothetical protein